MSDKVQEAYDAFISYRHSELDIFVAEQLHRELEAFRLPKKLVREKNLKKDRIERVFRDKDELPLAANLSNPIMKALEVSGYLVVICTPRLPQSQWCHREIETFIRMHGRDKVLAVLAEGEPQESFPEILCCEEVVVRDKEGRERVVRKELEPLAADVRGNNKKEIKKKIKQEVIRLAAAMFECGYDDLKQRHREQKLRKRFQISMGVSAALLVFGCVSCYQAVNIDRQAKEIKRQYIENLKAQSDIMTSSAKEKLEAGQRKESIECALRALPDNLEEPEYPINYQAVATLTEALRVYDNGYFVKPDTFLEQDADIEHIMYLGDGRLVVADVYGTLTIWDMENRKILASYDTEGFSGDYQGKLCVLEGETLLFLEKYNLSAVNVKKQEKLWTLSMESSGKMVYNQELDKTMVVTATEIYEIDEKNGKIVKQKAFAEEAFGVFVKGATVSKDGSVYYVALETSKGQMRLYAIDSNSLEVIGKTESQVHLLESMAIGTQGDTLLLSIAETKESEGQATEELFTNTYYVVAYDTKKMEEKWRWQSDELVKEMNQLSDGQWVIRGNFSVGKLDGTNGTLQEMESFDSSILNVYMLEDERLFLLMKDGSVLIQDMDAFAFLNFVTKYQIIDDWLEEFLYANGNFITLNQSDKKFLLYNSKNAEGLQTTEYTEEEIAKMAENKIDFAMDKAVCDEANLAAECDLAAQEIVISYKDSGEVKASYPCKAKFVKLLGFSETGELLVVQYVDNAVEIIDTTDLTLKQRYENMEELESYNPVNSEYFVLSGANEGYIIETSSFAMIGKVEGYITYKAAENAFLVHDSKKNICQVPFYSMEELVNMAKTIIEKE